MIRYLTSALFVMVAWNAHALVEDPVTVAELVEDVDVNAPQETFAYDVTMVDDLGDEELYASLYEMRAARSKARVPDGCGAGRSCAVKSQGIASWYGPGFSGHRTANGERFNPRALTAASKTYCFNSLVRVSYRGRTVVVRINDAGPYVHGRVIDLSKAAAEQLGLSTGPVTISLVRCGEEA